MMYLLLVSLLTFASSLYADLSTALSHGRAIAQAQKGDWKGARERLQTALVHNPDNPTLLYDLGVASYKQNEFDLARVYFEAVVKQPGVPSFLQERAYFNAGNTAVALKQLPDAVDAYEQVLKLNEHNEEARHNLALVKKMLQEQQKKDQQKQNKQQDKQQEKQQDKNEQDQKQDQSDQSNGQDKKEQSKQQGAGDQQDKNDGNEDQDTQSEGQDGNQRQQQKQKGSGGSEGNKGNKDDKGAKGDTQQKGDDAGDDDALEQKEDNAENKTHNSQKQGKDNNQGADKQQGQQQQDGKNKRQDEKNKHENLSGNERDQQKHNTKEVQNKQAAVPEGTHNADPPQPQSAEQRWIAQLMEQQEERDARANKRVIRRAINQKLSGSHGQNRW